MVKKILSVLGIVGILSTMVVQTAFAAEDNLVVKVGGVMDAPLNIVEAGTAKATVTVTKLHGDVLTSLFVETAAGVNTKNLMTVPGFTCADVDTTCTVDWDGKDSTGKYVDEGTGADSYKVYLYLNGAVVESDFDSIAVTKDLWIESFTVPATWNPSAGSLSVVYALSKSATVNLQVMDGATKVKTLSGGTAATGTITWDGKVGSDLVFPKTYALKLIAIVGQGTKDEEKKEQSKDTVLSYTDPLAPTITDIKPVDAAAKVFTAKTSAVAVSFVVNHAADVTVEVKDKDGKVFHTPVSEDGVDGGTLSFDWDGTLYNAGSCVVPKGLYTVEITARNNTYGVAFDNSLVLDVDPAGLMPCQDGATKIKNISFDPSGTWDPLEEKLAINWDLSTDFDKIKIEARKSGIVIDVYEEDDLDIDDYDVDFEGKDDDDEYLDQGEWMLLFLGEKDNITYFVEKKFTVGYAKPEIDETFVTKTEIDPEFGEGVYFGFKMKDDAKVTVEVQRNSKSKVDLVDKDGEDVSKEEWYAAYWDGLDEDGDEFDKDDSFKILLTACSLGDDKVCDTKSVAVDLDDDDISSSKSNITKDLLVPPVVEQGDDVELTFNVEDSAKLRVGIWKGTSTSGSPDVELLPYTDMKEGDYKFVWDTKDEKGKLMAKGYYSYKIFTQKTGSSSTETESGKFVIGSVGDVFGGPSETVSDEEDTSSTDYKSNPYLVIEDDEEAEETDEAPLDVSFPDVLPNNKNHAAIVWAAKEGIFAGDPTGTFRPYDPINRAEVLLVVMKAFGLPSYADNGTNLGWTDVKVGEWYMGALRSGQVNGLLAGDGGKTTVRPAGSVNRAEFLRFVYESAKITGVSGVMTCSSNPYSDVSVGSWFTNYVCQSQADGLFDVVGSMFLPSVETSRGEVAEALYRLLGN